MKKSPFRIILALLILMVALAACAGGTGETPAADGTTGGATGAETPATGMETPADGAAVTQEVPETGADANCVGVDTQALMTSGQTFYTEQCAGCHGEQGEGQGDFPGLAGAASVTGDDIAGLVQAYFAVDAHPKDVTPDDLAAVLTYSRGSFGNMANPVCPTDIQVPAAP